MTREEAIALLKELQGYDQDVESSHSDADKVLCELLSSLGYGDVVEEWEKVWKWYA